MFSRVKKWLREWSKSAWARLTMRLFILALVLMSPIFSQDRKAPELSSQIEEVKEALQNLRNLDEYLENIQIEMVATQRAKEKIELEYSKVKALETLTKERLDTISLAVNRRTTKDIALDYFFGFILGIAGSLVASTLHGRYAAKQKTLNPVSKHKEER